ncbi:uncharacterized protein LOC132942812 [Metopolophium dirhodum]|uniref:uncharacterized protein LOC132942812 n=1 Tax=Metopolophium dirhodum TaxID=44670 RepID=UPI0029900EEB|nr:uncharacterized protein LOC132942812 [Metopolophium dirhodum]
MHIHKIFYIEAFAFSILMSVQQHYVSAFSTADQIISNGYPVETYEVETKDHYMVGLERIPYSKNGNKTSGKPIILLHGLYGTSMYYTLNNISLSFILSDAGFDVWLLNFRLAGISKYIKNPRTGLVTPLRNISWDFSFDELGIYDTTAGIDFILNKTGYSKIHMGGYSFGATICLIALAERPEYNEKIDKLVLIVPTARMKYYDRRLIILKIFPYLFHRPLRGREYVPKMKHPDDQWLGRQCKEKKYMKFFCLYVMTQVQGNLLPINYNTIEILRTYPQPTSVKVMTHYYQLILQDYFRKYDYGKIGNIKHYNSTSPPDYDLSKVIAPTYVYQSKHDIIAPPKDVKWLVDRLPNIKNITMVKKFSHMGFAISPYAKPINLLIAKHLLENTGESFGQRMKWEKIKNSGYPLKMYEYQTEDHFMLGMERIPYSKYGNKTIGKPVILLSGMFATSIVYVSHNKSLGYLLSDAGFDVWLFNYRVTGMSKKIKDPRTGIVPKLSSLNWDYSFHELAIYDLPAAIDLVISVTGYSKVDVGGVSLGGTIPLITLAERPEYNKKVRNLVLMAPASRMGSGYQGLPYYFVRAALRRFIKTDFSFRYISLNSDPDNIAVGQLCRLKMYGFICVQSMNIIQGMYHPLHIEPVIDVFTTYPQPTSVKTVKHYFQLLLSGRFTNYDYGPIGNMAHYHSRQVPEYDISKITAPAIIMYSKRDNLVPPQDIKWLLNNLPNIKSTLYIDKIPFSHQSFVMDKNSHLVIGPYIVKQLSS